MWRLPNGETNKIVSPFFSLHILSLLAQFQPLPGHMSELESLIVPSNGRSHCVSRLCLETRASPEISSKRDETKERIMECWKNLKRKKTGDRSQHTE